MKPYKQEEINLNNDIDKCLNRIKRAYERKTGCYLTADMIQALGITELGEWLYLEA